MGSEKKTRKKYPFFSSRERLRRRILRDYKRHPERYADPGFAEAVEYVARNGTSVFPYPFTEKYDLLAVGVHEDEEGMPYVDHRGRKLYFPQETEPEMIASIYRALIVEQDPVSPHCYRTDGFVLEEGDILFDVGAAEGIFALDNIEKVSRVFLFETDQAWIEPLKKTFGPWKEKVEIVNKFVSDTDGDDSVTVDTVVREYDITRPLFLKLDVEGAEESVLKGAAEALSKIDTKAVICTYHRHDDHTLLSGIMEEKGYKVRTSEGYMLFMHDRKILEPPFFRRGVIYCSK